jgi:tartrate dehydrogenase/decarboxylase/D-malate dehydrogenase
MATPERLHRIAVYPGDGIGRDVTEQAVRVLEKLQALDSGLRFECNWVPWGAAYYREHGRVAPADFLEQLRNQDAILLGAVGWPAELPDHVTLGPLVELRQRFDQYACVRPARLLPGLKSVLASKAAGDIDLVVVRENSEGEYVNNGGRFHAGQPDEFATQTAIHTRRGIERILHFGFQLARTRRKKLTMITKSNAMRYSYVLWDEVLDQIAPQYADVITDKQHADAAVMNFVRWPETFDVVVASNLFGDILTDLGGVLGGGLGLAPSANLNPEREFPSMFEPVHGSAPDIAGKGIANPTAAILSAAMMLDWLGEASAATRVRQAVEQTIATGHRTPDLGGRLTTTEMADHILGALMR